MDTASTSVQSEFRLAPHSSNVSRKSLVPPARSRIGTGAQSEQVHHHKNLLMDAAPVRGICHSLCLTQPLETRQLCILDLSYHLRLQGDFLDFSLIIWLVHPR